jgi:hypothetical protein
MPLFSGIAIPAMRVTYFGNDEVVVAYQLPARNALGHRALPKPGQ